MALPGVLAGLAAAAAWGAGDFNTKTLFSRLSVKEYLVWSTTLYLFFLSALALFFWDNPPLRATTIGLAAASGIIGGLGNITFLIALHKDKLSLMTALGSAYPALTILLGVLVLGETLSLGELGGIAACIAGVIVASMPTLSRPSMSAGTPFILGSILLWGVGFFLNKLATDAIGWFATNLFIGIAQFLLIVPFLLISTDLRKGFREGPLWRIAVSIGLILIGMLAFSIGVSVDRVSIVTPLSSLFPIVAIILGYAILKEKLAFHQYGGIATVLGGILLLSL